MPRRIAHKHGRWWWTFKSNWEGCKACPLCEPRQNIVQFRGRLPSPIAFIGEAPGDSEDVIGEPFCGPAGTHLDDMVREANLDPARCFFANIVACKPFSEMSANGLRVPTPAEAKSCRPRLLELIEHCEPSLVVTLGQVAARLIKPLKLVCPVLELIHPSAILQSNNVTAGLKTKRFILSLRSKLHELEVTC